MSGTSNPIAARGTASSPAKKRFMARMVTVLIGGMFLDGYVLGIIGPLSVPMANDLGLSALWTGLIAAAALVGILVGSPIGGWAADKWGRKPIFMFDLALFAVASALQIFVDGPVWLLAARLLMGLAIGCEYSVGWPLLSEFSPARSRGRMMVGMNVAWYAGFMVAFLIGHMLIEYTDVSWRLILASSTVIAVLLFLGRLGMPESPRWLWSVGRKEEARALAEAYLPEDALEDIQHEDTRAGTFSMLFSRQYWRATLFLSTFWFCAAVPYFAIATFADSVLKQYGLSGPIASGVGLSALALAGVVVSFLLVDKVGRRMLTVPPQWLVSVVLAVIALWSGMPSIMVLVLFLVFSFVNGTYSVMTGPYSGEIFPTEIRGMGTGFACAVSRVGGAIGTFLLPVSMDTLGPASTMLIAAGIAFVGAGVSQWLAPETKGMTLTEAAAGYSH